VKFLDNMVLFEFIPRKEFQFTDEYRGGTCWVPTEFIITKPDVYSPQQARYWEVPRWHVDGKLLSYNDLRVLDGFIGTGHYDQILLVEVWVDSGEDGHVDYSHHGYRYVPKSQFDYEMKYKSKYDSLPECMHRDRDYKALIYKERKIEWVY